MSHQIKGDGMHFWKIYELVGSTAQIRDQLGKVRTCRFCRKDEKSTNFKTDAHALPELLGENNFVIPDECDQCNTLFSVYESHLSKFFLPYLSTVQVKGKKRVPAFHSRTEENQEMTRTIMRQGEDGKLQLILGKHDDLSIDHKNKKFSIRYRLAPHKPFYVYKALVKIGLSVLLPQYIEKYRSVIDWLMGENPNTDYFPIVYITPLYNKKFATPFAELYQAKSVFEGDGFHPEMTLIVNFGNLAIQIFMPLSNEFDYERSRNKSPQFEIYPAFAMYNFDKRKYKDAKPTDLVTINFKLTSVDLSSHESLTRDETINFSFSEFERKIES
jgi:hypothetical protein